MRAKVTPREWKLLGVVIPLAAAAIVAAIVVPTQGGQASGRVGRCTERLMRVAEAGDYPRAALERYAERIYCRPFDEHGWVYPNGTFKLAAYTQTGTCSSQSAGGGPSRRGRCDRIENGVLDCGLLRFVRRPEAQRYIEKLRRRGPVECDDKTPLKKVGA
jgi:hypothetical protein